MRKKGCKVSKWTYSPVPHPKQLDSTSCGVFALKVCLLCLVVFSTSSYNSTVTFKNITKKYLEIFYKWQMIAKKESNLVSVGLIFLKVICRHYATNVYSFSS